jgi:hypothetical protein
MNGEQISRISQAVRSSAEKAHEACAFADTQSASSGWAALAEILYAVVIALDCWSEMIGPEDSKQGEMP